MGKLSKPPQPAAGWWSRPGARLALLALLVVVVMADVFRLGWFADDFLMVDAARRLPLAHLLSGQHGIYPWYRPLSRELFYELIVALGPLGPAFAHLALMGCVFGCAWALMRIGARLVEPRLIPVAPALLVTYAFTKFLAGWSAGFQDLLALFLVLAALADFAEGRWGRALLWAALAPFAKETGFVALPLMIAYEWFCRRQRRWRGWLPGQAAVWLAAAAVHVAVRLAWRPGALAARVEPTPAGLLRGLGDVIGGFIGRTPVLEPWAGVAAMAAGASAALLLLGAQARRRVVPAPSELPSPGRSLLFLLLASAAGLAPMIVGQLTRQTHPNAYYALPAVPWLALAAALALGRLPHLVPRLVVPALVAWNTWCLGYSAPAINYSSWRFARWDWAQAVRLSEFSKRLTADVRRLLSVRPESLVVVYDRLPMGCYFQTEDGPATRESLRDPTVRAYYFRGLPGQVNGEHLAILRFDPDTRHLVLVPRTFSNALGFASYAIMGGSGWPAYAFASSADTTGPPRFALLYLRAAARLLEEGPRAFLEELAKAGIADTTGPAPQACADAIIPRTAPLNAVLLASLRHPLSAAGHAAYGAGLEAANFLVPAGVEYRLAVSLDPRRIEDRLQLASILMRLPNQQEVAAGELARICRDAAGTEAGERAQTLLRQLDGAASPPRRRGG